MSKLNMMLLPALALCLSGCSVTGLGGKSSFSCGAPEGSSCKSLDAVYDQAVSGNATNKLSPKNDTASIEEATPAPRPRIVHEGIQSGMPVRSEAVVMRICLFPWQDSDNVLHDISYQYVTVNSGNWLIDHNRAKVRASVFTPLALQTVPIVGEEAASR
jgi:conjugal transfer pilus assembly protein TraV